MRRLALPALSFVLGLALTSAATLGVVRPPFAVAAWSRLRRGAAPSAGSDGGGVVMTLAPSQGSTIVAWFENVGRAPTQLCWRERPGDELGFAVETDAGPCAPRGPDEPQEPPASRDLRWTTLAPGERLGLVCDLRRWVTIPDGPTTLRVRGDRAPLGDPARGFDGHRCRSNGLEVELRP